MTSPHQCEIGNVLATALLLVWASFPPETRIACRTLLGRAASSSGDPQPILRLGNAAGPSVPLTAGVWILSLPCRVTQRSLGAFPAPDPR